MVFSPQLGKDLIGKDCFFLSAHIRLITPIGFLKPRALNICRICRGALFDTVEQLEY